MALSIWPTKMRIHIEFGSIAFVTFLTVLEIFDDEFVNSTFTNKKMVEPKWLTKN